ncbi:hypothetical protein PM082_012266 [Marasmius tenuissimus]|nr:hypothetical protein PM082_012266 [Marasmius tenuissimus]
MSPLGGPTVSQTLEAATEELVELERDSADTPDSQNKRDVLMVTIQRYRSLLSPIHRLPFELLGRIFEEMLPKFTYLDPYELERPLIVSLSMVCGRWRETIISIPSLWSNISLYLSTGDSVDNCAASGRLLRLFLDRSQAAPSRLVIYFPFYEGTPDAVAGKQLELLSAFTEHAQRWEYLALHALPSILHHSALRRIASKLSTSQHLSFHVHPSYPGAPAPDRLDIFRQCPSLTSFQLYSLRHAYLIILSWNQVTKLNIADHSADLSSLTTVLGLCCNLRTLTLSSIITTSTHSLIPDTTLHRLENLTMNNIAPTVLPSLVLPRLSTLSLHESRSWGKSNIPQYTDFLRRGSQTITHLVWQVPALETTPMSPLESLESEAADELLALLRVLPNLQHLHISQHIPPPNEILTPAFFRKLFAFQDGASPVLPRLRDLTIELGEEDVDIDGIVGAVRSRNLPDRDDSSVRT